MVICRPFDHVYRQARIAMKASGPIRRRHFLQGTAATAGILLLGSKTKAIAENDKLNLAFIGVGGRGGSNLKDLTKDGSVNVVSICDVNGNHLDRVGEQFQKARRYADFRRLLDDLKDVDAVVVSSTEHTHAFATLPALQMKKPVYCEKHACARSN